MEVPRLGVESELQMPAYTAVTATPDLSHICDLHHSARQRCILNPVSEARARTRNFVIPSWIHFRCTTTGIAYVGVLTHRATMGALISVFAFNRKHAL